VTVYALLFVRNAVNILYWDFQCVNVQNYFVVPADQMIAMTKGISLSYNIMKY